jgi:chromosome segregation ATPase
MTATSPSSEADIDAEITRLRKESADIVGRARMEHEKKVEHLLSTHEAELHRIRTEHEKQIEQLKADKTAATQQLEEDVEQLETISQKYKSDLTLCQERNASSVEKLRQSEASKTTVVTGLQHEKELLQEKLTTAETLLQTEKGLNADLRRDKESIQKQLELVTLRLPAPRKSIWDRLFGRGPKE